MLDPHDRGLLSAHLLAPEGFRFTDALICTYSLDLTALAGVPLSMLQIEPQSLGDDKAARIAAIGAIRELAGRFTVVCQAAAIHVPPEWRDVYLWIESMVVQVSPKTGRSEKAVFHPKVWLLRFAGEEDAYLGVVRYRLLVLSRNLTYDRSWDVCTRFDGEVQARQNRIAKNGPLVEFVQALGANGIPFVGKVDAKHTARRDLFARELRVVRFGNVDEHVSDWEFFPLGIAGHPSPLSSLFKGGRGPFQSWAKGADARAKRNLLVVSPFISDGIVKALADAKFGSRLISRRDSLDQVAQSIPADWLAQDDAADARVREFSELTGADASPLSGLHAKLWIADDGHEAHVWLGSANATVAAFTRNVEFLVRLTGMKSRFGIEALGGADGMGPLTVCYMKSDTPETEEMKLERKRRAKQEKLGWLLMNLAVQREFEAHVDAPAEGNRWALALRTTRNCGFELDGEAVSWSARPITLRPSQQIFPVQDEVRYVDLDLHELTCFWSIKLSIPDQPGQPDLIAEATVRMEAQGPWPAMAKRESALVSRHLNDAESLTLYLEFLLAGGDKDIGRAVRRQRKRGGDANKGRVEPARPLFETLLLALATRPQDFGQAIELIEQVDAEGNDLRKDPRFQRIWAAFREARDILVRNNRRGG